MPEPQTEFTPNGEPQFARLTARRHKKFPYNGDEDSHFHLRLRRSVGWLGRAERELYHSAPPDLDMAFTCYWFAFNALYAKDHPYTPTQGEKGSFKAFFETVIGYHDECKRAILDQIQGNLSEPIKVLLDNKYAFEPFWKHHNGVSKANNWTDIFEDDKREVNKDLRKQNVVGVLSVVFYRLYVVRNQIVHGNATWNGGRNYDQLRDAANIMASLVPQLITSVMNNREMKLGRPYYTLPRDVAHHPHNTTAPRR